MNHERIKDIIERVLLTFIEGFIGAISVDVMLSTTDRNVWKSVLLGAVCAGISAVLNLARHKIDEHKIE